MELPGSPVVKDSEIPLQGAWLSPGWGTNILTRKKKGRKVISSKNSQKGSPYKPQEVGIGAGPHR